MTVLATLEADGAMASVGIEQLYQRHARDVFRIVHRLLGPQASEADVDDLVQQTFIAAHRALPGFRGDSQLSTWLYGIASRQTLAYLRKRRRYRALLDRFQSKSTERLEPNQEQRAEVQQVWRALGRISPKKRVAYLLHDVEGHSAPDIARMLEVPEPTVRSRLRHARKELAAALEDKS